MVSSKSSINQSSKDYDENMKIPKINIEFCDLEYSVPDPEEGKKQIIKSINGEFRGQQLTAIVGPSGSGKTTLLKILAGFKIMNTQGSILINRRHQNFKAFHKICRYIPQEDHVSPYFTVREFMTLASNLKFGSILTADMKIKQIKKILDIFQLQEHQETLVNRLSGGERKRLCIALELLNNPAVLILDEPTTGLDEHSATQCISLLKHLAQTGRTVICSVHAPSARLCKMFDKVYVLAEGECLYQGSPSSIVPFLGQLELYCPLTYNPADFIIECANREYGNHQQRMCDAISNGQIYDWTYHKLAAQIPVRPLKHNDLKEFGSFDNALDFNIKLFKSNCSWYSQYRLLLMRMLLEFWRNKFMLKLKIFIHIFLALCIGTTYKGLGIDATMTIYLYQFSFCTVLQFVFTSAFPIVTRMPLEFKYLRREYFNQWYSLSSYFMALLTSQLPEFFLMSSICSAILYLMTDQPAELFRYGLYLMAALLTSLVAFSFGIVMASFLSLKNVIFLTSACIAAFMIFAFQSIANPQLSVLQKFLMYISFYRHAVACVISALMKFGRKDAPCPDHEMICIFKLRFVMKLIGFDNLSYAESFIILLGFYLFFNLIAFSLIRYRLKSNQHIAHKIKFFLMKYFHLSLTMINCK